MWSDAEGYISIAAISGSSNVNIVKGLNHGGKKYMEM